MINVENSTPKATHPIFSTFDTEYLYSVLFQFYNA